MNKLILILVLVGLASAMKIDEFRDLWSAWKTQNQKTYTGDEDLVRFANLVKNYEKIQKLNDEHKSAKFALNKFSDLTREEFAVMLGSSASDVVPNKKFLRFRADVPVGDVVNGSLPQSIDWRKKGAITPVKDQGQCGSCWSFGATGILESFYFLNNGKLLSFSEQQLMDCETEHSKGCKTGYTSHAITYVAQNGIQLETDYPYTAKNGTGCQFDQTKAVKVGGRYSYITPLSSDKIKAALVKSPVSVLIQADEDIFQHYKSGVLTKGCGAKLDHSVLVVGYQEIEGEEAFIIKNSWGPTWGQQGYVYLGTDETENEGKGVCGILSQPMIVTV